VSSRGKHVSSRVSIGGGVLQLPEDVQLSIDVRERLEELRNLSKKVQGGDKDARRELKRAVRESSPAVIARASDIGRKAQHLLIQTAAGKDPLVEWALSGRLDLMRREIAGENPTPLEVLLTERVVACWLLVELFEALMAPQLWTGTNKERRTSFSFLKHYLRWQETANKRYLAAIRELARLRKLQINTPGVSFNTQINVRRE
jgi:hypothetical protein